MITNYQGYINLHTLLCKYESDVWSTDYNQKNIICLTIEAALTMIVFRNGIDY